jgi:hypothetical protein
MDPMRCSRAVSAACRNYFGTNECEFDLSNRHWFRFNDSGFSDLRFLPNFARNLAPEFTHYISERPEMTSSKQGVKEGNNKKGN